MRGSIWGALEIAPTTDRREIRQAYARRLKLTNPEDDPEGFQALRQAYDWALAYADRQARTAKLYELERPQAAVAQENFDDVAADDLRAAAADTPADILQEEGRLASAPSNTATEPDRDEHSAAEARPQMDDPVQAHGRALGRLAAMLEGGPAAEPADLRVAMEDILRSQAMQQVQVHANTESWLAGALAFNIPRSDPLIRRASEAFNWEALKGRWDLAPQIHLLLERAYDLDAMAKFADRRHSLNAAYRVLTTPPAKLSAVERFMQWRRRGLVKELLHRLRQQRPSLLELLDKDALAVWSKRSGVGSGRGKPWNFQTIYGSIGMIALVLGVLIRVMVATHNGGDRVPDYQDRASQLATLTMQEPGSAANWLEYCKLTAYRGADAQDAEGICDNAVRLTNSSPEALHARAFQHLRSEEYTDAIADYSLIVAADPKDARAQYGRGLAFYELGRKIRSTPDIGRAVRLNPHVADDFADLSVPVLSVKPDYAPPPLLPVANPPVLGRAPTWTSPPGVRNFRREPTLTSKPLTWSHPPSPQDVQRFYPPAALGSGLPGVVSFRCSVLLLGKLRCAVLQQSPAGQGFGSAALKVLAPVTVRIGDGPGATRPSSTLTGTLHFYPPRPAAPVRTAPSFETSRPAPSFTPPKDDASGLGVIPNFNLTPGDATAGKGRLDRESAGKPPASSIAPAVDPKD